MPRFVIRCAAALMIVMGIAVTGARVLGGGNMPLRSWLAWLTDSDTYTELSRIMVWDGSREFQLSDYRGLTPYIELEWLSNGYLTWVDGNVYLWDRQTITTREIAGFEIAEAQIIPFAWSNDLQAAWVANDSDIFVLRWNETAPRMIYHSESLLHDLQSSSDGQLAWVERAGDTGFDIFVWNGQETINITQEQGLDERAPRWSNDGRLAWIADKSVFVWNGSSLINLNSDSGRALAPEWSNDGQLAFDSEHNGDRDIYVWNNGQRMNVSRSSGRDEAPIWSSDGWLAWLHHDDIDQVSEIFVWNGTEVIALSGDSTVNVSPSWSPQGWLAWGSHSGDLGHEIYIWDRQNTLQLTDTVNTYNVRPVWSPPLY